MMSKLFRAISIVGIMVWLVSNILAQSSNSSLSGSVTDMNGANIAEVNIRLTPLNASATAKVLDARTNYDGNYKFENLVPGRYVLRVGPLSFAGEIEKLVRIPEDTRIDVSVELGKGCGRLSDQAGSISEQDKAEVFKLSLINGIGSLVPSEARKKIVLSAKNIRPDWIKNIGIQIKLMSPEEIESRASRNGDFLYLSISNLQATGGCIAVSVNYMWATDTRSPVLHMDGGGISFEFRRENGKWIGNQVAHWVS